MNAKVSVILFILCALAFIQAEVHGDSVQTVQRIPGRGGPMTVYVDINESQSNIRDEDLRETARHSSKESLLALSAALINTLEGDEAHLQTGIQEMKDIIGHVYVVQGEDVFKAKDVFDLVPMYMVAGLYESATSEIVPTISKLQQVLDTRMLNRTIQGEIDREKEIMLSKTLGVYTHTVYEALRASLARGDVDTCWILCRSALESPHINVRTYGIQMMVDLLPQARGKGIELIPDKDLWILLDKIERHERSLLVNPDEDFTNGAVAMPWQTYQILTSISDIRDFYLDPEGKVHNLTPRRDVIMTISH